MGVVAKRRGKFSPQTVMYACCIFRPLDRERERERKKERERERKKERRKERKKEREKRKRMRKTRVTHREICLEKERAQNVRRQLCKFEHISPAANLSEKSKSEDNLITNPNDLSSARGFF